jgi:hypothetical protein
VELQYVFNPSISMVTFGLTPIVVRLENEHLGNVDQYRVTREVPLPYSMDEVGRESEGEEDMDEDAMSERRSWRRRGGVFRRSQEEAGGAATRMELEHHSDAGHA